VVGEVEVMVEKDLVVGEVEVMVEKDLVVGLEEQRVGSKEEG